MKHWHFYWCPDGEAGTGTNVVTGLKSDSIICPNCGKKMQYRFSKSNDDLLRELAKRESDK